MGAIYAGSLVFATVMVGVLIPAIAELARSIGEQGPAWIESLNEWSVATFGVVVLDAEVASSGATGIARYVGGWTDDSFGVVTEIASAGVGFVFSLATIAILAGVVL